MTITKLERIGVAKPWGVDILPAPFTDCGRGRIGEIWFKAPEGEAMPLLVKYLFTSERLSIQVHPDDDQARQRGLEAGKEECWFVLEAGPGAVLGVGTSRDLSGAELREAALSGEIERLMTWHPVEPGMLFHIPPGTVHAIGAGISLIEVQQNSDVTYRLYDYGRPRELHLEDGVAVSVARPFPAGGRQQVAEAESRILLEAGHFVLLQITADDLSPLEGRGQPVTVIPLDGEVAIDGEALKPGECALAAPASRIQPAAGARCLVAWPRT